MLKLTICGGSNLIPVIRLDLLPTVEYYKMTLEITVREQKERVRDWGLRNVSLVGGGGGGG